MNEDSGLEPRKIWTRETAEAFEVYESDVLLSSLRNAPGATDTFLDVIAGASTLAQAEGPVAILGFAVGSVLPPLRAMGCDSEVHGVDLWAEGLDVFRERAASWCGEVKISLSDAEQWLDRTEAEAARYAVIVDDLSVEEDGEIVKPFESIVALPRLAKSLLAPAGLFVSNVLPREGVPWEALLGNIASAFERAIVVTSEDYENRLLIAGEELGSADSVVSRLDDVLGGISAQQRGRIDAEEI